MSSIPAQDVQPGIVASGAGEARWWAGQLATIKATAADTGGQFSLIEIEVAAGFATPLHIHHREDEAFWILDGHATVEVGDQVFEAPAGTYLMGPRHVPHRWTAGPDGARMLYLFTPGGFEDLVLEMSVPAEPRTVPSPDFVPSPELLEIAERHGVELLG
jgi:quercetin dioxygenase-like cupin family protein